MNEKETIGKALSRLYQAERELKLNPPNDNNVGNALNEIAHAISLLQAAARS